MRLESYDVFRSRLSVQVRLNPLFFKNSLTLLRQFKVKIRHELAEVKVEALQLDGNVYIFREGWVIGEEDSSIYVGEVAMIPQDSLFLSI